MKDLTPDDIMPFGVHKGKAMKDIPDGYFKHLYHSVKTRPQGKMRQVILYITDNTVSHTHYI